MSKRYRYICPKCHQVVETAIWEIADRRCPRCKAIMNACSEERARKKPLYERGKE